MKGKCKHLVKEDSGNNVECELSWTGELCDSIETPETCEDYEGEEQ